MNVVKVEDEIVVRQTIEAGLRDSERGNVTDVDEVRASFGLSPESALDSRTISLEIHE